VTSIYTCTDEYIQPYKTSMIPGAKNIELCDGFIGHFQFFYDREIYKLMLAELTAPISTMPPQQDPSMDPPADDDEVGGGCSTSGGSAGLLFVLAALALRRRR
jgi:MYXO-CTERM domain-containing protein